MQMRRCERSPVIPFHAITLRLPTRESVLVVRSMGRPVSRSAACSETLGQLPSVELRCAKTVRSEMRPRFAMRSASTPGRPMV